MTRINVGIDPSELPDKLLIAEHREITRIPNAIRTGRAKINNIPSEFTLGKGHVKFFYPRLLFLKKRYISLLQECLRRNFKVTDKSNSFDNLPEQFMQDYEPAEKDRQILIDRIQSKGNQINFLRFSRQSSEQ